MKLLWSPWIPYPRSWLRAFIASVALSLMALSMRITGFWGGVLSMLRDNPGPFVLLAGVGFLLPCILVALSHHLILGRRRTKRDSLREGFNAAIIITVTTVLVLLCVIPLAGCISSERACSQLDDAQVGGVYALWLVISAYLYQYDYVIRSRRTRSKPKHKPINPVDSAKQVQKSIAPTVDPVEAELNAMKKQHEMKKRKD
jgi:hypothetical protein